MKLPNFMIIGAAKSGTTSLAVYMGEHPDVGFSKPKEPMFFYWPHLFSKGIDHYLKFFEGCEGKKAVGEASTAYIYGLETPARIKQTVPHVRLIALLRNPVDRAYSHYLQRYNLGKEKRSFEQAIEEEPLLIGKSFENRTFLSYLDRGMYSRQIKNFLGIFESDQLLLLLYDDLRRNPDKLIKECFDFIGVDSAFTVSSSGKKYNVSSQPRSVWLHRMVFRKNPILAVFSGLLSVRRKAQIRDFARKVSLAPSASPPMNFETRKKLIDIYKAPNRELEELLGRDLASWSE